MIAATYLMPTDIIAAIVKAIVLCAALAAAVLIAIAAAPLLYICLCCVGGLDGQSTADYLDAERITVLITHDKYEVTHLFVGFIWKGRAIVGVDLDHDAWGLVAGKYYAGWKWE